MWQSFLSIVIGLVSALAVYLFFSLTAWWQLILVAILWLGVLVATDLYLKGVLEKKFVNLSLLVSTVVGFVGLSLVVELPAVRWLIILSAGLILGLIFSRTALISGLSHELKPLRRMVVMLWVGNLYSFSTMVFALAIFLDSWPIWLLSLILAIVFGVISVQIWYLYFAVPVKGFLLWALVVGLIFWEIIFIFSLLPLGYFASSALVVWLWYIAQLFVRFHLSTQGIVWRKQIAFLLTNLVLFFVALIFFVKWI